MNEPTKPSQLSENGEPARRIAKVLAFDDTYGHDLAAGDPATATSDALDDLMHLADAEGLRFNRLLSRARWHYRAEIAPWDDEIESAFRRGDDFRLTPEGMLEFRPHQPPTEGDSTGMGWPRARLWPLRAPRPPRWLGVRAFAR